MKSTAFTHFGRTPLTGGIFKKCNEVTNVRHRQTLIDEETKIHPISCGKEALSLGPEERRALVAQVKAAPVSGEENTPFEYGIWVFGCVRNRPAKSGLSATTALPKEVMSHVSKWWWKIEKRPE